MDTRRSFSWSARARSFIFAWRGLRRLVADEHNARIHLGAAVVAVALGLYLRLERWEWTAVVICIAAVIAAEAFNSAIEAVCDRTGRERHPLIEKAKDIAAAGVMVTAIGAVAVGILVYFEKLTKLFL